MSNFDSITVVDLGSVTGGADWGKWINRGIQAAGIASSIYANDPSGVMHNEDKSLPNSPAAITRTMDPPKPPSLPKGLKIK